LPKAVSAPPLQTASQRSKVEVVISQTMRTPAFEGEDFSAVVFRMMNQAPRPPSDLAPITKELEALILRCLAKAPRDRPQTMRDVENSLREMPAASPANLGGLARRSIDDASDRERKSDQSTVMEAAPLKLKKAASAGDAMRPVATADIGSFTAAFLPELPLGLRREPSTETVWFNKPRVRIGRSQENDLVLLDAEGVSRFHAEIVRQQTGYAFADLGSRNGSLINGHRVIEKVELKSGAVIEIGNARIVVDLRTSMRAAGGKP
jgi:serine/threonine protein kinase